MKILVAEDNNSNWLLVRAILKGYELKHVINGQEAVDEMKNNNYDLILMDMKMPIMGGLEATHTIRTFNKKIPIIALTAYAFETDREKAMAEGCNAFVVKPLKKSILEETIRIESEKYQQNM